MSSGAGQACWALRSPLFVRGPDPFLALADQQGDLLQIPLGSAIIRHLLPLPSHEWRSSGGDFSDRNGARALHPGGACVGTPHSSHHRGLLHLLADYRLIEPLSASRSPPIPASPPYSHPSHSRPAASPIQVVHNGFYTSMEALKGATYEELVDSGVRPVHAKLIISHLGSHNPLPSFGTPMPQARVH